MYVPVVLLPHTTPHTTVLFVVDVKTVKPFNRCLRSMRPSKSEGQHHGVWGHSSCFQPFHYCYRCRRFNFIPSIRLAYIYIYFVSINWHIKFTIHAADRLSWLLSLSSSSSVRCCYLYLCWRCVVGIVVVVCIDCCRLSYYCYCSWL